MPFFQVGMARALALLAAEKSLAPADLADYLLPVAFTNMCLPSSEEARCIFATFATVQNTTDIPSLQLASLAATFLQIPT